MDSSFVGECRLGVDFHPDRLLYTAAQKAGIDNNMGFPWKTNMRITKIMFLFQQDMQHLGKHSGKKHNKLFCLAVARDNCLMTISLF